MLARKPYDRYYDCHGKENKRLLPTIDVSLTVHGPLMEKVTCSYAMSLDGKTAYMEMAAASGLTLVPEDKRNPMEATTYGVGEISDICWSFRSRRHYKMWYLTFLRTKITLVLIFICIFVASCYILGIIIR